MVKDYSSQTDHKLRWGGILEYPYVSKVQRHCLDGFKVTGLSRVLKSFSFKNILDVGCGLGEYSLINKGAYVGIDNSFPRVKFAQKQYPNCRFLQADAVTLPFKNKSFEAVMIANTAHHLSDEELKAGLRAMKLISYRYLIIDDCIRTPNQSRLSKYFYSLDRGTMFRTAEQFQKVFKDISQCRLVLQDTHITFPGLYTHAVFVLEIDS